MDNCIFCKIIKGEIPSITDYEDNNVKAFLDISQYDEELAKDVFAKIPMIARAVKESDPEIKGLNIVNNNGELAYQSVFHSHVHLIPRYTQKDGFSMSFKDNSDSYDNEDLKKIAENIKQHLG